MGCLVKLFILVLCTAVATDNVVRMSQSSLYDITWCKIGYECDMKLPSNFSFASYYGDNMVLQRAPKKAVVWGYSPKTGDKIHVVFDDKFVSATTVHFEPSLNVGIWKVKLPPVSEHGPFTIEFKSSLGSISLKNVLFGDVWICSGQSNMQFTTSQAFNAKQEIQDANNYPDIRLFTVSDVASDHELIDLPKILQPWSVASNESVGGPPWKYFSAVCWFYGKNLYKTLGYPIGLIATSWGGTPIEVWTSKEVLKFCGIEDQDLEINVKGFQRPDENVALSKSALWNSMIHPFLNMTIYGAIWYQGESNTGGHYTSVYNCTFPAMIKDWRNKFNLGSLGETDPVFPFGFVQLAPFKADQTLKEGYPDIRWHQTADYGYVPNEQMPNVFMAVAVDLPDFTSPYTPIHPRDKEDATYRLTLSGLAVAYKRSVHKYQGPLPSSIYFYFPDKNITLNYKGFNLQLHNVEGFELCCSIGNSNHVCNSKHAWWVTTPIIGLNSSSVSLYMGVCDYGQRILGIRYLWRETPCPFKRCAVYSEEGLPAPPFLWYRYNYNFLSGNEKDSEMTTVYNVNWNTPVGHL